MTTPAVSVLMPVYNVGEYLRDGIDSILEQTFTDFEFIIVNDGSTDGSLEIIKSYSDPHIRYTSNEKNEGLIYTLNKGLEMCKGRYIARMDGDDVSHVDRLKLQYEYMEQNPEIDVLASCVRIIDENGKELDPWKDDINHVSRKSIRNFLSINNCIAHPTVMIKGDVLREYRYNPLQKLSEDYDLWLRMTADGKVIEKLKQPLLNHRYLLTSFTRTRNVNIYFKLMRVKLGFVKSRILAGEMNSFVLRTLLYSLFDGLKGIGKKLSERW